MRHFLMDQVCAALFRDSDRYHSSGAGFPSSIYSFCIHRLSAALYAAFLCFCACLIQLATGWSGVFSYAVSLLNK
ncbi:hypothetical protein [Pseudomonas sp. FME51]|uniref:hypothetical protein n=1 Tax=Pseudomonas sp. FME51 TaxID=2742609 RepID=UPI0018671811|nr:hypothetical protein [Pseudomonas sp. FME51]